MAKGIGGGSGGGIKAIFGTNKDDVLKGDHNDGDTIYGLGGNDTIKALNGIDFLYGGDGNDRIFANGGNDWLIGGLGNDYLDGGAGIDTAAYADVSGAVTVDLAFTTAQNTGSDGIDTLVSIENLISGAFNDTLLGNALANVLSGQDGDDALAGREGDDTLNGGNGNDILSGGSGNDLIVADESGPAGNDLIDGGAGIDTLDYTWISGAAGVSLDLRLTMTQNTGGAGFDTVSNVENIIGSARNDILNGSDLANNLNGGAGNDSLAGNGGDDVLNGFTGSDNIFGGAGNDIIDGGMTGLFGEMDMLSGGAGADRFLFANAGYSLAGSNDQVMDFSSLEGDKLDVHGVFAPGTAASFIGAGAFTGVAGQVQVITSFTEFGLPDVNQFVRIDVDGNGVADFSLFVTSNALLTASDFIF
ncbi:MAG: calcium-binding protein [Rhizobiaceae bacterium]